MTLSERYFEWMYDLVRDRHYLNYKTLLKYLDVVEFTYTIDMDGNREADGIDLRYRFGFENDIPEAEITHELDSDTCSVLEMLVALASRIENIMEDSEMGDQTPYWFWSMICSLKLDDEDDRYFNEESARNKINNFLDRNYKPNGEGGLFTLKRRGDIRGVEIWIQAMWYLDEVMSERR